MKNYRKASMTCYLLAIIIIVIMALCSSCSSSSHIYERGTDGRVHKVSRPQCIDNW